MNRYNHLGGTQMHDIDTEKLLLIQNTLGVTAFAKMGIWKQKKKQKWFRL